MADNYGIVLTETYEIISKMGNSYINKIPKEIWNTIKENRDKNYSFSYDETLKLVEQNVKKATLKLLSYINLNYWCNEEEKKELRYLYKRNKDKVETKKILKKNFENIFEKMQTGQIIISGKEIKYIPNKTKIERKEKQISENLSINSNVDVNSIEYLLNKKAINNTNSLSVVKKQTLWNKLVNKIRSFFKK